MISVGLSDWENKSLFCWYPTDLKTSVERLQWYSQCFPLVEEVRTYGAFLPVDWSLRWAQAVDESMKFIVVVPALFSFGSMEKRWLPSFFRNDPSLGEYVTASELDANRKDRLWQNFIDWITPLHTAKKLWAVKVILPSQLMLSSKLWVYFERLRERLPVPVAVEFHNRSWLEEPQFSQLCHHLRQHDMALVHHDRGGMLSVDRLTHLASWGFILKLFGDIDGQPMKKHAYRTYELERWAERLRQTTDGPVAVLFANHLKNLAVLNGQKMQKIVSVPTEL